MLANFETSQEDDLKDEDLTGRHPYWKTSSKEDDLTGRQPHRRTNSKEDELGTAQPQLVFIFMVGYNFHFVGTRGIVSDICPK